jgi:hypothetical protein
MIDRPLEVRHTASCMQTVSKITEFVLRPPSFVQLWPLKIMLSGLKYKYTLICSSKIILHTSEFDVAHIIELT